jgi:hypothetical protein
MEELLLANATLALLEKLLPRINAMVKSGQISPEDQQKVRDRFLKLQNGMDTEFTGPEWEVVADSGSTPVGGQS